jgi:hypothetical protein
VCTHAGCPTGKHIFCKDKNQRFSWQHMMVKQCLVGVESDLFAFSVFLAMAAPTVLFAVLVSVFVLGLAPAVVFKFITPFSFFSFENKTFRHTQAVLQMPTTAKTVWWSTATCWNLAAAITIAAYAGGFSYSAAPTKTSSPLEVHKPLALIIWPLVKGPRKCTA